MQTYQIALLGGDGIGPEVVKPAVQALEAAARRRGGFQFEFLPYSAGAAEYLRSGTPLPDATLEGCAAADATLLGAMGLPSVRWPSGTEMAPQIDLREQLDLFSGVRPIYLYNAAHSPLKRYGEGEIDFVLFRENTEGMFASRKIPADLSASEVRDTLLVTRFATERICREAFLLAQKRRKHVTLVDKANVLPTMAFFRSVFQAVAEEFPDVQTDKVYVDAAALFLVKNPHRFDVLVMENLFGDILSDLAAGLVGGMGMAPSADVGSKHAVFQPSHGSAPDIAGKGIANPVATILSAAMMLDWLGGEAQLAAAGDIRAAVRQVMADPANATPDIEGSKSTGEVSALILRALEELPT
ncbi:MAG: isocitrate/isopropylmalate dehydrogenase family protein [Bryobacteraceae bacterium]